MRFTKIRLTGLSVVDLPIVGALPSDPYILKEVDGLGPPEVDVTIAATLNTGGIYQGRRPQSREPVLRVGLNPNYSVGQTASDMRSALYGMLTPGFTDNVKLEIMNENTVIATTTGYLKKLEISPFSKTPEVQITMACLQAYLEAPNYLYIAPGGSKSLPEIVNHGTADTGFHMEVQFTGALSSWVLADANSGKKMQFDYSFVANDKLAFDTRPGSRSIFLTRDLITTSIIYALSGDSVWHMLYGGNNVYSTNNQAFNWGDVYYQPKYWGI